MIYLAGRIFQIIGLITLPSTIWVGHFAHSERASIGILLASLLIFALGTAVVRFSTSVKI